MSDSISSGDKSPANSSASKSKDSGSADASGGSSASSEPKSDGGGDGAKSAKELVGGAKEVHYGFFSSVRNPAYRSGWDDVWGNEDNTDKKNKKRSRATNAKAKPRTGAKPVTAALKIEDLPADVRDGLVDVARKKMRRSRASFDKLDASGLVDWAISVTLNGGRR